MPAICPARLLPLFAAGLIGLVAGAGSGSAADAQPPQVAVAPLGAARFVFYREFFPDDTGDMPAIAMNGALVGYGLAGTNFYRDVPAGRYHLTVASIGTDVGQAQDVAMAPGDLVFIKIASLPSWEEGGWHGSYRRGTYYVMVMSPRMAALELPQTRHTGGN